MKILILIHLILSIVVRYYVWLQPSAVLAAMYKASVESGKFDTTSEVRGPHESLEALFWISFIIPILGPAVIIEMIRDFIKKARKDIKYTTFLILIWGVYHNNDGDLLKDAHYIKNAYNTSFK